MITTLDLSTDYSASPLWHDGLLDRNDLPLTGATWTALEEWARYYNEHDDGSGEWTPGSQRLPSLERGNRLAERVAAELGHEFAVKHEGLTFRSDAEPTNAAAAGALHAMVRSNAELDRKIEKGRRQDDIFDWQ